MPGNHIGDIGAAVQAVVEAAGFSVVRDLVGHGIGVEFHEEPQVPNYGKPKRGLEARARADDRDRADGEHRRAGDAHAAGQVDDRDGGRLAVGALRAHGRDHGAGASGADAAEAAG